MGIPRKIFAASQFDPSCIDQSRLASEVVHKEPSNPGESLMDLAYLPEFDDDTNASAPPLTAESLQFGVSYNSPAERAEAVETLSHHLTGLIDHSNGAPPPAIGAVCDIDVGDATPIALRARKVRADWLVQLWKLLKDLSTHDQ